MQNVEGITRQPLGFGLLSVVTPRPTNDVHWQNEGVRWDAIACSPASGIGQPECAPGTEGQTTATGLPKNLELRGGETGEAEAFTVYGVYNCNPVGRTIQYAADRATEHLLAREEARAEQAIWTGDLDNTGFAAGAEAAVTGAVSLKRAIAALEGWLADNYGSRGVLHMTREAGLLALDSGILEIKGSTLQTKLGTPVVAGAGYPGTGPTEQAPAAGTTYVYATPAMLAYRTEVFAGADPVAAGLDRSTNNLHAVAERTYLVGWDPCGTAFALANLPE
jgi:hypothetical protein